MCVYLSVGGGVFMGFRGVLCVSVGHFALQEHCSQSWDHPGLFGKCTLTRNIFWHH